jgi:hypothetical protein
MGGKDSIEHHSHWLETENLNDKNIVDRLVCALIKYSIYRNSGSSDDEYKIYLDHPVEYSYLVDRWNRENKVLDAVMEDFDEIINLVQIEFDNLFNFKNMKIDTKLIDKVLISTGGKKVRIPYQDPSKEYFSISIMKFKQISRMTDLNTQLEQNNYEILMDIAKYCGYDNLYNACDELIDRRTLIQLLKRTIEFF